MNLIVNPRTENLELISFPNGGTRKVAEPLGIPLLEGKVLGWTITMPTDTPVIIDERYQNSKGKLVPKRRKIRFDQATSKQQVSFLVNDYIPNVVTPLIDRGIGIFELTKKQEIHCHIIGYDTNYVDDVDLRDLQKSVSQLLIVRKITKGCYRQGTTNYIHYLKDIDDWYSYLDKYQCNKYKIFKFKRAF